MHQIERAALFVFLTAGISAGCMHPRVTAVSLSNPHERDGIPFYLPKPLLIISKNFRNIEEAKVGLTDTAPIPEAFDDQAKYADVNARTNFVGLNTPAATAETQTGTPGEAVGTAAKSGPHLFSADGSPIRPGVAPSDGLSPSTFYTYQIVFVPDMTQKYGLRVRGGVGEIRAAMNLVNGWQFTGLGPYYMKDSSTAQNILSTGIATRLGGQAVADVVNSVADLAKSLPPGGTVQADDIAVQAAGRALAALPEGCAQMSIPEFAEIHVFEPHVTPDGRMEWCEIANLTLNREYLGSETPGATATTGTVREPKTPSNTRLQSGEVDPEIAKTAVAHVFGVSPKSAALTSGLQAGEANGSAGATISTSSTSKEFNFLRLGGAHHDHKARGSIVTRIVTGLDSIRSAGDTSAASVGPGIQPLPEPRPEPAPPPPGP